MKKVSRRSALKSTLLGAGGLSAASVGAASIPTPPEVEGPFYPATPQKDKDFDLTRIDGHTEVAKGLVVEIVGRVLDVDGKPIEDASVDLWQANDAGRYAHPRDRNPAPVDPHFQGWAMVPSGKDGGFRFKTIKPGVYPASKNWDRPPHIHFKVTKFGYQALTTQMYFPGEALNDVDRLLQRKGKSEQALMIAAATPSAPGVFRYDIILASADSSKKAPQQE